MGRGEQKNEESDVPQRSQKKECLTSFLGTVRWHTAVVEVNPPVELTKDPTSTFHQIANATEHRSTSQDLVMALYNSATHYPLHIAFFCLFLLLRQGRPWAVKKKNNGSRKRRASAAAAAPQKSSYLLYAVFNFKRSTPSLWGCVFAS
jgi:hypothetical protein